jgi:hypothetical protein
MNAQPTVNHAPTGLLIASMNFSKYPIEDWVSSEESSEHLWAEVITTKKYFRQHPIFSWVTISEMVPQYRSPRAGKKSQQ